MYNPLILAIVIFLISFYLICIIYFTFIFICNTKMLIIIIFFYCYRCFILKEKNNFQHNLFIATVNILYNFYEPIRIYKYIYT